MLRKFVTMLIVVPIGILLVIFMVANRHAITVSLDPFGSDAPSLSVALPLFLVILLCLVLGVVAGGVAAWMNQARWRRAARRFNSDARALRIEREALKGELAAREPMTRESAAREPMALPLSRRAG